MATVPTPITFAAGSIPTAADLNGNTKTPIDFIYNPPSFSVQRISTAQSITNAAVNQISFDTEVFDTDTMWVSGSPTVVTVQTAGLWLVTGVASFAANATGSRIAYIYLNGNVAGQVRSATHAMSAMVPVTALVRAAVGDTFSLRVYQNSGGALNTSIAAGEATALQGVWLGK